MYDKEHVHIKGIEFVSGRSIISCDVDGEQYLPVLSENPEFGTASTALVTSPLGVWKVANPNGIKEWVRL